MPLNVPVLKVQNAINLSPYNDDSTIFDLSDYHNCAKGQYEGIKTIVSKTEIQQSSIYYKTKLSEAKVTVCMHL